MYVTVLIQLVVLIVAVVLHEVAHGVVAYKLGDSTAHSEGRLTLNPIKHVDIFGSVILPLLLVIAHSPMLIGWAKPVPIQPRYFKNPIKGMCAVAAAGPAVNLTLAVLFAALFHLQGEFLAIPYGQPNVLGYIFYIGLYINISLALFNLFPIPPLDGSRVIMPWVSVEIQKLIFKLEPFGFMIIALIAYMGGFTAILGPVLSFIMGRLVGI